MTLCSVRRGALTIALALFAVPQLPAQTTTGTIRGRVTDADNGRGLPDAQVTVTGTRIGAVTGANGEYVLASVPAGPRSVTVRRLGYEPVTRPVAVTGRRGGLRGTIALSVSALNLAEVVVTGSATPTEKKKIGTSVAAVDSTLISRAQAVTVDQAMQGKIPGAQITQNSGGPGGGGISVRLRGTNSFIAGSDPLYIVDGVIIDNGSAQLADLGGRSNPQNRRPISSVGIARIESSRVPPPPRSTARAPTTRGADLHQARQHRQAAVHRHEPLLDERAA